MAEYLQVDHKPLYDLIIDHKILHELSCVLYFSHQEITLNGITLPMGKIELVQDRKVVFFCIL